MLRQEELPKEDDLTVTDRTYSASEGTEAFISLEDPDSECLVGYVRLRIPSEKAHRKEVAGKGAGLVREIHVLGPVVPVGESDPESWQHKGYGSRLLHEAEDKARDENGCRKVLVTSALGSRRYFMKHGYRLEGPYMYKELR